MANKEQNHREYLENNFFSELKKLYRNKILSSDAYMFALEQERFKNKTLLGNLLSLKRFNLN